MVIVEIETATLLGPDCKKCGANTRVIGIEDHWAAQQLSVVTAECEQCGALDATIAMPPPHGERDDKPLINPRQKRERIRLARTHSALRLISKTWECVKWVR
jgi:hypothetical protein